MRVLLLNMPVAFNKWQNLEMPLGVAYIASSLLNAGHEVIIKDFEVEHFSKDVIDSQMKKFKPQVIGLSFRTASYRSAVEAALTIKSINPKVMLICGGHHSTAYSENVFKETGCDIVVRGEAEETVVDLMSVLDRGEGLSGVAGISYKNEGSICRNKDRELTKDINKIRFPEWNLLPMQKYSIHSIITSRGCPFSCIYCDKSVSTRQVRCRNAENVYEEIVKLRECYGDKLIYFVDDFFFQNRKMNDELFRLIKPFGLKWQCQSRADAINKELVTKAKDAGCETIIFGLETGDQDELKFIRKKSTLEQARNAVVLAKESGIHVRANFMLGFPISTEKTLTNTIRFARSLPIDNCRFFIVTPLPNTELWEYVHSHNLIAHDIDWKNFDLYSVSFRIPAISAQDLISYAGAAYLHVLKKRILREMTIELPGNLFKFATRFFKTGRIRGNISPVFSSSVNLLAELWFLLKKKSFFSKLCYLFRIAKFERNISKNR